MAMIDTTATTFAWAKGMAPSRGVPAEEVGAVVTALISERGVCSAPDLVDEARPESSPIHDLFEWDDPVAAELYRTQQARAVIRALRVVRDGEPQDGPSFVHVAIPDGEGVRNGYLGTDAALTEYREQVLSDAVSAMRGLQKRYGWLSELEPVFDALPEVPA